MMGKKQPQNHVFYLLKSKPADFSADFLFFRGFCSALNASAPLMCFVQVKDSRRPPLSFQDAESNRGDGDIRQHRGKESASLGFGAE